MKFLAHLDGSIICPHQSRLEAYNKFVKKYGKVQFYVELLPPSKKRTNNMNRYLHAVVLPHWGSFLAYIGYTKNDRGDHLDDHNVKDHLKATFLSEKITSKTTGRSIVIVKGTSELSIEEFSDFLDAINRLLIEQSFAPLPIPYYTGVE